MKKFGDVFGSSRKLLLTTAGLLAIAVPLTFGLTNATPRRARSQAQSATANADSFTYDVVSVKPFKPSGGGRGGGIPSSPETLDGFIAGHVSLRELVQLAFGMRPFQVQGAPSWFDDPYSVDARMDGSRVDALQKLGPHDRILAREHMLQALLADRFKLTFRQETKEVPVFFLVIARDGPRLQEAKPGSGAGFDLPDGTKAPAGMPNLRNTDDNGKRTLTGVEIPISALVEIMTYHSGDDRPILDKTGLTGNYNFAVRWVSSVDNAPLPPEMSLADRIAERRRRDADPDMLAAIEKQLGLKLESGRGPVEYVVIDHVERPSEN
jgi:uncharacterized protein (TIGR03435 family)